MPPPLSVVTSAHGVSTAGSDAAAGARGGGGVGGGVARRRSVVTHGMAPWLPAHGLSLIHI